MLERPCDFCDALITSTREKIPRACGMEHTKIEPSCSAGCWLNSGNQIKKLCVMTFQETDPRKKYFLTIRPLFRKLGDRFSEGPERLPDYFKTLTTDERKLVKSYAHPELKLLFDENLPPELNVQKELSRSKRVRHCGLCDALIKNTKGRYPRACGMEYCSAQPPEHSACWLNHDNDIKAMCVETLQIMEPRSFYHEVVQSLLKRIGGMPSPNRERLVNFLKGATENERYLLLKYAAPRLKAEVANIVSSLGLETKRPLSIVRIPNNLPKALITLLNDYKGTLERRHDRLIKFNHVRSIDYMRKNTNSAISFCVFLAEQGYQGWEGVSDRDVVKYLADKNRALTNDLKRFIRFAEKKRNPFRKNMLGQSRRKGAVLIETPRPKIVPPRILDAFLKELRETQPVPEYLLAWFVCKFGLTSERAYSLNLSEIMINDAGRCVVRPARIWVNLPKAVGSKLISLADSVLPGWQKMDEINRKHYHLFHNAIPSLRKFRTKVLQGHALTLRSSALYAMMENGHLDRVTLLYSTGVSTPTIAKLERLFSADVHRRLDPDFIKLRNRYISGEAEKDGD